MRCAISASLEAVLSRGGLAGRVGEGACGGKKNDGEVPAIPVDAAKVKAEDAAAKPVEKPADKY